jgi:hypothetical protein
MTTGIRTDIYSCGSQPRSISRNRHPVGFAPGADLCPGRISKIIRGTGMELVFISLLSLQPGCEVPDVPQEDLSCYQAMSAASRGGRQSFQ